MRLDGVILKRGAPSEIPPGENGTIQIVFTDRMYADMWPPIWPVYADVADFGIGRYADMGKTTNMVARQCMGCGKRHWGECPERVERIRNDASIVVAKALGVPAPVVAAEVEQMPHEDAVFVDEIREIVGRMETTAGAVSAMVGGFAPPGQCQWCDHRRAKNAEAQRKRRGASNPSAL